MRFARKSMPLVGILLGLAGCLPAEGQEDRLVAEMRSCASEKPPRLWLGEFGRDVEPLDEDATLPVWVPLQGGVVVGLNVLAEGVPRDANPVELNFTDVESGETVGAMSSDAAFFICHETEEVRMWDRIMVPLENDGVFDAGPFDGRTVELFMKAGFPNIDGDAPVFATVRTTVTFEAREPPRDAF